MVQPVINKGEGAGKVIYFRRSKDDVAETLRRQIANAFNLYLNYKHYHWQTLNKPLFRDLHIIFDEFANEVYSTVESLAERVRTIGQNRVRVREFQKNASVKPAKKSDDIRHMIEEADKNAQLVIREMRAAIASAERIDPVSTKLLKRSLKIHEKHQWWLHYILDKRQGLAN